LLPIFIIQTLLFQLAVGQHANFDHLDPKDEMSEDEFEKFFHNEKPEDPEEYGKREDALRKHEKEIHDVNEKYQNGESSWFDEVNELSDLPDDEFVRDHTGAITNIVAGRGLLEPPPEKMVDPASEAYFASIRMNRGSAPDSYSSLDLGLITPVKNQGRCGSCVAFAEASVTETCFMKETNSSIADISEQHFLDCGYKKFGAAGCNGAWIYSYSKHWAKENLGVAHENQYAYKMRENKYKCPADLAGFNFGAEITENYYTYSGTEDVLKELVFKHGAVMGTVQASGPFGSYKGGVFAGCDPNRVSLDHAITVVGYGTENGVDYWLIKNSWSTWWGEKGYIKLKRGVEMCGIGRQYSITKCSAVSGSTETPPTTKKPCLDESKKCPELAKTKCYKRKVAKKCQKSCGLCEGMTPASSKTCYNKFDNCDDYIDDCDSNKKVRKNCKITCGTCPSP